MKKDSLILKNLFNKSYNLYVSERYKESLNLLNSKAPLWFDHHSKFKFIILIGMNFYKTGQFDRAERSFYEALSLFPENIKVMDLLGKMYFMQKRYIDAERIYMKAKREDYFNFEFSIKAAQAALLSKSHKRMFRRLKEGYLPEFITHEEEKKLKKFLLDYMKNNAGPDTYEQVKKFRSWCHKRRESILPF